MAKIPTRATHIGYQAPNNYVNPGNILKGYLAASEIGAKQQQKDDIKQRGIYDNATQQLQDFTSDISPNLQSFVAESLGGIREQMFSQYNNYISGGDNATHNQMYMNNAANEFQAFAAFGKGFEKNLNEYEKRAAESKSSAVEGYFSLRYAAQADFSNKKMVLDRDGHLWMMKLDKDGNFLSKETMSINQLNNYQALHQDKVTFTDYTKQFSKNIEDFKKTYRSMELGLKPGEHVTLEGMALLQNNVPGGGGKEAFEQMYQGTIDGITESLITQPNVAASALTERLAPNGQVYFFYNDDANDGGQFSLNGRDKENGIYMKTDGDLHERAVLTDGQKDLLKDYVTDNLNAQIGFTSRSGAQAGYYRRLSKRQQAASDIATAMKMRMGDEETWKTVITRWNNHSKTNKDEKILSYRVDPDGVSIVRAGGSGERIKLYDHAFSGEDASVVKTDITTLMNLANPNKYTSIGEAEEAFEIGKDNLPAEAKVYYDEGFRGTRGVYTEGDMPQGLYQAMKTGFGFTKGTSAQNQDMGINVGNMIDVLASSTVNFNPVNPAILEKSPVIGVKVEGIDAGGATTVLGQANNPGGLNSSQVMTGMDPTKVSEQVKNASLADKVTTTITVLGGADPNNLVPKTFVFQNEYRGPQNNPGPSGLKTQNNEAIFKEMLNYIKEPMRDASAYGFPASGAGSYSKNYKQGILNFNSP